MLFKSPGKSFAYLCKPSLVFGLFRRVTPFWSRVKFFASPTSPSTTRASPLSLYYCPLPLQNLASHNLVSRGQSVVVLKVEMVYDLECQYSLILARNKRVGEIHADDTRGAPNCPRVTRVLRHFEFEDDSTSITEWVLH